MSDTENKEDSRMKSAFENADFETAIAETGFGKFNYILLLIAIPSGWAALLESISMSYVFPAAQCDLQLTMNDKGLLNAATYIGMIASALVLGFISDMCGRKFMLVGGFFLDAVIVVISSLSQDFKTLLVMKFLGGFVINGPYSAHAAYIAEFHGAKYRTRVLMIRTLIITSSNVLAALLAWGILPRQFQTLFFNKLKIHPWNVYLVILAIFSFVSSIGFSFMPESPKYLMSIGKNKRAMDVFRTVYRMNTGRPKKSFPIKSLVQECNARKYSFNSERSALRRPNILRRAWAQLRPLFLRPYRDRIIKICLVDFGILMGAYSLKLWLPQMYAAINTYKFHNNGSTSSLCEMLFDMREEKIKPGRNKIINATCETHISDDFVYLNTVIVASTAILGFLILSFVINHVGKKLLLCTLSFIAGVCCILMYFAKNTIAVTVLSSILIAFLNMSGGISIAIAVDAFPTSLRTLTISTALTVGKTGATLGNLIFRLLLKAGCWCPFLFYGLFILGCSLLSTRLPNTNLIPLQ